MAPEQMDKLKGHTCDADIWALGVIAFIMITGMPFTTVSEIELLKKMYASNNVEL